jgi:hypothetical protein
LGGGVEGESLRDKEGMDGFSRGTRGGSEEETLDGRGSRACVGGGGTWGRVVGVCVLGGVQFEGRT